MVNNYHDKIARIFRTDRRGIEELEREAQAIDAHTVPLSDRCAHCYRPMLYRCDEHGNPVASFCGSSRCIAWLIEMAP